MSLTLADAELHVAPPGFTCRSCGSHEWSTFCDLGDMPLANAYLAAPDDPDPRFPLHARLCRGCLLVQADAVVAPQGIFSDYAFFSSYSRPWVAHCHEYADAMIARFDPTSVLEIASNDGCLLEMFPPRIKRLGIDPAENVAEVARGKGVATRTAFFGTDLASTLDVWDLVVANNVLGHVPDLNDFVAGLAIVLAPEGVLTVEVPWLLRLIEGCQFDTIYHEHFNYFSYRSVMQLFERHGLRIFDIEKLDIHGGSLRFYVCRAGASHSLHYALHAVQVDEFNGGLHHTNSAAYRGFDYRAQAAARELGRFLQVESAACSVIAGAGAPAKGNTLLNAARAHAGQVRFVTDVSPHKQGTFLPGSHIPVLTPEALKEAQPDYVVILAWNWAEEIMRSLAFVREWGGRFVIPVPEVSVV